MTTYEPSPLEVKLTLLLGNTLARPFYTSDIRWLGLRGDERVLDFGAGSGVCSQHLARHLLRGNGHLTCIDVSRVWHQVIQETLRTYPNVDYACGDIAVLDIPDATYDAVFVHFVLHDIPTVKRPGTVKHLSRKLAAHGKLFIREPIQSLPREETLRLMQQSGLGEISSSLSQLPLMGATYEGVFARNGG